MSSEEQWPGTEERIFVTFSPKIFENCAGIKNQQHEDGKARCIYGKNFLKPLQDILIERNTAVIFNQIFIELKGFS